MTVAILALQGAFAEHGQTLDRLGVNHFEVRKKSDLEKHFDALILPGGESTVIGKLLRELDMLELLRGKICPQGRTQGAVQRQEAAQAQGTTRLKQQAGIPVMGTCAGLILLAKEVEGEQAHLGTMNIRVKRNAYGRQLGSFYTEQPFAGLGTVPMTFIRAPYIAEALDGVQVLAEADGRIVAAREGNQLVTAFHPELSEDLSVHKYFLNMV